jgi:hypothetical protein
MALPQALWITLWINAGVERQVSDQVTIGLTWSNFAQLQKLFLNKDLRKL